MRDENIKAIQVAAERYNAKDVEGYLVLYDRGVAHHGFGNVRRGVGGLREHFQQVLLGFPGAGESIVRIFSATSKKWRTGIRFMGRIKANTWDTPLPTISSLRRECCCIASSGESVWKCGR